MARHREAVEGDGFCGADAAFLPGNLDLLGNTFHTVKIGKKEPPARSIEAFGDDAIVFGVKGGFICYAFWDAKNIDGIDKVRQFLFAYCRKAGII